MSFDQPADLVVVAVALGDRALEDGGIGRHADDAAVHHLAESAVLDEGARQVVDPHALAVVGQLLYRGLGHGNSLLARIESFVLVVLPTVPRCEPGKTAR
jgi:hypothetical protein